MFRNFGYMSDKRAIFFFVTLIAAGSNLGVEMDDVAITDVVGRVFGG